MATTSLQQATDNRGNAFYAVRPGACQVFALSGATSYPVAAFAATTRAIRICAGLNDILRVSINGLAGIILARGVHQDFIVQPGDTITLQLDPISASGNASVMELA
jgi:hypothetical protein